MQGLWDLIKRPNLLIIGMDDEKRSVQVGIVINELQSQMKENPSFNG